MYYNRLSDKLVEIFNGKGLRVKCSFLSTLIGTDTLRGMVETGQFRCAITMQIKPTTLKVLVYKCGDNSKILKNPKTQ